MSPNGAGRTVWLTHRPIPLEGDDVAVVVDATWSPASSDATGRVRSIRDVAGQVLAVVDPIEQTSALLDAWAAASGVVEALTIGTTSFWYRVRLGHWLWLQEHVLWALILRRLVDELRPSAIACTAGTDEPLRRVAQLVADAAGLAVHVEGAARAQNASTAARAERGARHTWPRRVARRVARMLGRGSPRRSAAGLDVSHAREAVADRLDRLAADSERRLLVVLTQLPQQIETDAGPRRMNPNIGPIVDRLRGTRLDPIILDRYARLSDHGPSADRVLPFEALASADDRPDPAAEARARRAASVIADAGKPVVIAEVDLGPDLARHVADDAREWLPRAEVAVARYRHLLTRLPIRAVLVADEYHRQDCLEAAAGAGIPVAAIQHGTIYPHHNGYIHRDRPAELRLPDRTYVFGSWERDLLVRESVYRDDEVVVGGSPRLDLVEQVRTDRSAVRAELGVEAEERLIVVSGTYGPIYRRFLYPVLLARLFDRPMPGVRLVIKQHPAEADEGPYRAVIEGVAAAGGFPAPPIRVVRDVDLYRILAAADAHLGIHSTVLTEAVFTGTPNLLAVGVLGGDLLDYVAAGVALPVVDGADVLGALDRIAAGAIAPEAAAAFIARHFEPGAATERIAADLLGWLV